MGGCGRKEEFLLRVARLVAGLALGASAAVVVLLGGPHWMSLLVVGTFMLASPGLVLVEMLRVRDGLLGLSSVLRPVLCARPARSVRGPVGQSWRLGLAGGALGRDIQAGG